MLTVVPGTVGVNSEVFPQTKYSELGALLVEVHRVKLPGTRYTSTVTVSVDFNTGLQVPST